MEDGTGLTSIRQGLPGAASSTWALRRATAFPWPPAWPSRAMIPVFAVYSTFLQRSYDMLVHDVALQKLHVVLGVDRAGLVGADGETHHGCLDVSYLTGIPGFTVLCPASFAELRTMLHQALFRDRRPGGGPVSPRRERAFLTRTPALRPAVAPEGRLSGSPDHLRNAGQRRPCPPRSSWNEQGISTQRAEAQPHRPSGHGGDPPGDGGRRSCR